MSAPTTATRTGGVSMKDSASVEAEPRQPVVESAANTTTKSKAGRQVDMASRGKRERTCADTPETKRVSAVRRKARSLLSKDTVLFCAMAQRVALFTKSLSQT